MRPEFLNNSLIVAAHADDEVLWFNSIVRDVDKIIVVFRDFWAQPQIGRQREAALADYPRGDISCLGIDEAGAYGCADWTDPVTTDYGMALGVEANRRALTRLARKSLSMISAANAASIAAENVARIYEGNFKLICDELEPMLGPDMNVFTHNPWGEYGHEEHIQVFRALQVLRHKIGFRLWMSNYCTDRAMPLAMRYFQAAPGGYIRLPTNKAFATEIADVYKKHDCWTWADDWAWFDEECFMEAPACGDSLAAPHRHLFPLNFFTIDPERSRKWVPLALSLTVASAAIGVTIAEAM